MSKIYKKMAIYRIFCSWIPLVIIYFLNNSWWELILKLFLLVWILVNIQTSFRLGYIVASESQSKKDEGLGPVILFASILFACWLWIKSPSWLHIIFTCLIVLMFIYEFFSGKQKRTIIK